MEAEKTERGESIPVRNAPASGSLGASRTPHLSCVHETRGGLVIEPDPEPVGPSGA